MKKLKLNVLFFCLFFFCVPLTAVAGVITSDTVWEGEVFISEDVVVPEGITLTVRPGTIVKITPSESTKTDPEYTSPLTEITIRGTLKAEGSKEAAIVFLLSGENKQGGWAGIIIDGGIAHLSSCIIQDAETGIYVLKGSIDIKDSTLIKNRYGITVQGPDSNVSVADTQIRENDYGVFLLNWGTINSKNNTVQNNKKKDNYSSAVSNYPVLVKEYKGEKKDKGMIYGNEVLLDNTIWQGRIEVDGIIRVPEGIRLIVMPGTIVEFKRRDTNNDGIGENGLMIQGVFIAKGARDNPIIFRSAEKNRRMGDWDAINIMNSDGAQNLIEFCQIEDAYRGLHFHFSNVSIKESILRNNYRGIQFQESAVEISRTYIYGNKSGLQARDSEIVFTANYIYNNYSGMNLFRTNVSVRSNKIVNNYRDGLRLREGMPVVEENLIDGNRYGLMVSDSVYGNFIRNVISNNLESGLSLKGADNIEVVGNFISGNGFNGINLQDSRAVIKGNHISGNGERGLGIISFDGIITENNIVKNRVYALGLDGEKDINAPENWWGEEDVEDVVYDKSDEPSRGRVKYKPVSKKPFLFSWPLDTISTDATWYGNIHIQRTVTIPSGITLKIAPNTKVMFSKETGIKIIGGKILATGERDKRIVFTKSGGGEDSRWDEIFIEYATGSSFLNCDFEYATWGLHSHFTNLSVAGCRFRKNHGGIRFRSGPVEIKDSVFEENSIGIRSYVGSALITGNLVTNNGVGIFVREKSRGLAVRKNNIFSNRDYNIRVGDFNYEDVDATENYWGSADPVNTIFDGRKEPGIGIVHYIPYIKEPFRLGSGETE